MTLARSLIVSFLALRSLLQESLRLHFLSAVSRTDMSLESMTTPRYCICCVGSKMDLSRWIMKPRERKSCTVACTFWTLSSSESDRRSESSRKEVETWPSSLNFARTGLRSFVNFLGANAKPHGVKLPELPSPRKSQEFPMMLYDRDWVICVLEINRRHETKWCYQF